MDSIKVKKAIEKIMQAPASISSLADMTENDEQELTTTISFVEQMFPDWIIMLCKATHKKFSYISPKCVNDLGYSHDQINRESGLFFMEQIHPEDIDGVVACFSSLVGVENQIADRLALRFVLNYRFRTAHGTYIHLHDEKFATTSSNGKLIGFTMLKDITHTQPFTDVRLKTLQRSNNRFIPINEYIPTSGKPKEVTAREADVLNLLQEGFSTGEIADRLSLSVNTVRNHRRHLFKKANVRNRQELLNFARSRKKK